MTNQDKIKEIREGYKSERDDNFTYKKEIVEQDIRFLLSEMERMERENRKLREDIERIIEILKNGQQAHWQTFKIRQLLGVNGE